MTADEPYVPHESYVKHRYVQAVSEVHATAEWIGAAEFNRFISEVRRDAIRKFIEACVDKRDGIGFLMPANYHDDLDTAIRVAESYVKNYPEEIA